MANFVLVFICAVYIIPNCEQLPFYDDLEKYTIINSKCLKYPGSIGVNHEDVWNKSITAAQYMQRRCIFRCQNRTQSRVSYYSLCSGAVCYPCSCDYHTCNIYGVCCPDIYNIIRDDVVDSNMNKSLTISTNDSACLTKPDQLNATSSNKTCSSNLALGCDSIQPNETYVYIAYCPGHYKGDEINLRLCHYDPPNNEITLDYYARAVDLDTNKIYRNVFCARCHGVVNMQQLHVKIDCKNYLPLYHIIDKDEMLRALLKQTYNNCVVEREYPKMYDPTPCAEKFFTKQVIDSCDVQHSTKVYDDDVVEGCHQFTGLINRYMSTFTGKIYQNIFCYICDTNSFPYDDNFCQVNLEINEKMALPLHLLLSFDDRSISSVDMEDTCNVNNCSKSELSVPNGQCLPIFCSPGKFLHDGRCTTYFDNIRGLGYRHRLILSFGNAGMVKSATFILNTIHDQVKSLIKSLTANYKIKSVLVLPGSLENVNPQAIGAVFNDIIFIAERSYKRDKFEQLIVESFFGSSSKFNPSMFNLHQQMIRNGSLEFNWQQLCDFKMHFNCQQLDSVSTGFYPNIDTLQDLDLFIDVRMTLTCPFVKIDPSRYMTVLNEGDPPHTSVIVDFNKVKLVFLKNSELNKIFIGKDGRLEICSSQLDTMIKENEKYEENCLNKKIPAFTIALSIEIQYYLTWFCFTVSLSSLVLTLASYACLPQLRNKPGKYNMMLCLSLLLAQSFLMAGTHRFRSQIVCAAVGIATHFCWLWMFSCSFVCSLHMFNIFRAATPVNLSGHRGLLKNVIVSLVMPTTAVVTVIVHTFVTTDGREIGYGQRYCYLDTTVLVEVFMIGPLILVCLCNLTFFVITVFTIFKIHSLQGQDAHKKDARNRIVVYMKLSSLTGILWLLYIIAELLDSDIVRCVAIIFNGLQGVLLFVSFVCTRRVINMWKTRLDSVYTSDTVYTN